MTTELFDTTNLIQPLDRGLRRKLEAVVEDAREIAETAAKSSLEQLGVGDSSAPSFLTEKQRSVRRRLRAHGRQLGDQRDSRLDSQEINRLTEEVAYEHWHRMLFARFLAENGLLMYPGPVPVAIGLSECEELAAEGGAKNGWELASRFAAQMLPQIFRPDSPVFEIDLPPEHQKSLENLVGDLHRDVFVASDSIGWIYQFWQSKRKAAINASGVKIGARELPSVTQLFTEPYMVSFLLDNTLGAWWAGRRLQEDHLDGVGDEAEVRRRISLPGVPLTYLRLTRNESGRWAPAAGTFDHWPEDLSEFSAIDPCCGSGHFLVAALLMLVPLRMALEGLSPSQAVEQVLGQNLHGLEIDQRCVELAAFALALTAWRYPGAGGYRSLPRLNVACSGLSVSLSKEDSKRIAQGNQNLRLALEWIQDSFQEAPLLGSLLNPSRSPASKIVSPDELARGLEEIFAESQSDDGSEVVIAAQGLERAASLLSRRYHWVVTNVPYKKAAEMVPRIQKYFEAQYFDGRRALETVFTLRCLEFLRQGGVLSLVLPQNWLFLTTYESFRKKMLEQTTFISVARLGAGAFETISGEVVKAILFIARNGNPPKSASFSSLDASMFKSISEKATVLQSGDLKCHEQETQLENPDTRIILDSLTAGELLSNYANSYVGLQNGDAPRYLLFHWEVGNPTAGGVWQYFQLPCDETAFYAGRSGIVRWENGTGSLARSDQARIQGTEAWQKRGIAVRLTKPCPCTLYDGALYDQSSAVIVPSDRENLLPIWAYCSSQQFRDELNKVDQKRNVTNATFVKVPFDLDYWKAQSLQQNPSGLPEPYSSDPRQWIFSGHPTASHNVLQVAVARLLGYRWPVECDPQLEVSTRARDEAMRCRELDELCDEDGIVCIPPVRGESAASERLLNLLAKAYGNEWSNETLSSLLIKVGCEGKTLDSWLKDKFFIQHSELFSHRPFIWHIWDGLRDGFGALVNYHYLDKKLLEALIFTYLGDWIARQKHDLSNGVQGAEERLSAASVLKKHLETILEGESPFDVFVRWKSIAQQPMGWEPDINDGVRLNIRPFLSVPDVAKKGAGVLRDRPNISWNKDRGNELPSAPLYSLLNGERVNDYHLALADKHAARARERK